MGSGGGGGLIPLVVAGSLPLLIRLAVAPRTGTGTRYVLETRPGGNNSHRRRWQKQSAEPGIALISLATYLPRM